MILILRARVWVFYCRWRYALVRRWIARQYLEFLLWRLDRID